MVSESLRPVWTISYQLYFPWLIFYLLSIGFPFLFKALFLSLDPALPTSCRAAYLSGMFDPAYPCSGSGTWVEFCTNPLERLQKLCLPEGCLSLSSYALILCWISVPVLRNCLDLPPLNSYLPPKCARTRLAFVHDVNRSFQAFWPALSSCYPPSLLNLSDFSSFWDQLLFLWNINSCASSS